MHILAVLVIFHLVEAVIGENDDSLEVLKMIKIFGKVTGDNFVDAGDSFTNAPELSIEECVDECFAMPECILSHMDSNGHCIQHTYDHTAIINVVETTKSDGYFVAIKSEIDGYTCPSSYYDINLKMSVGNNTVVWPKTDGGWISKTCKESWKMFEREDTVVVCMKAFHAPETIYKNNSQLECEKLGATLTGVASIAESDWIYSQVISYPKTHTYFGFFIDGVRNCADYENANCRVFQWSDGYTNSQAALVETNAWLNEGKAKGAEGREDCLTISTGLGLPRTVNDASCIHVQRGYVCGYRLV